MGKKQESRGKQPLSFWKMRRRGKERRKGSIYMVWATFEEMDLANVSLILSLAHTQRCMKQLQLWTLCTII